jgi:hypothetical protein
MSSLDHIRVQIELHSVEGIKKCFSKGVDPNSQVNGEPLIYELISEYTRSPRFKDCVQAFVDYGLNFEDKILLSVLLDDAKSLDNLLRSNPDAISTKYTLRCAYTPLYNTSLLHVCAEFNHQACAEILVSHGMNINVLAGIDEYGFGGHSPIFHTVNQNGNQSLEMFNYLLNKSADLKITVTGLIWGKGHDWETFIPSVNPVSYAMMGLLPQMHRDEITVSKTVAVLLKHSYGIDYVSQNIPCRYLKQK